MQRDEAVNMTMATMTVYTELVKTKMNVVMEGRFKPA